MDVFFVYGLVDSGEPDVIRYVGQTKSMSERLKQHYDQLNAFNGPAALWKRSVMYFGRRFDMHLLEVVYGTRSEAMLREHAHIRSQQESTGRIVNGHSYRAHKQLAGVDASVVTAYLEAMWTMHELLEAGVKRKANGMYRLARLVDELETVNKSLIITTARDSYSRRLRKRRVKRDRLGLVVST